MTKKVLTVSLSALIILILGGCASQDGQGRYRIASIGNAERAVDGEVLSAIPAYIERNSGVGAEAGGALGGAVAAENSDNAAVIIAGVIGGALLGNAIESDLRKANATQYVIILKNGAKIVVAQLDEGREIFVVGDQVLLVYGYPAQLIRAPSIP